MANNYDDYPSSKSGEYGGKKYSIQKELQKAAIRNSIKLSDIKQALSTQGESKSSADISDIHKAHIN